MQLEDLAREILIRNGRDLAGLRVGPIERALSGRGASPDVSTPATSTKRPTTLARIASLEGAHDRSHANLSAVHRNGSTRTASRSTKPISASSAVVSRALALVEIDLLRRDAGVGLKVPGLGQLGIRGCLAAPGDGPRGLRHLLTTLLTLDFLGADLRRDAAALAS
jgi:hypothetical protein